MKISYKGYQITVYREQSLGGWDNVYYSIYRESDWLEVTSGFYDGSCKVKDVFREMKGIIDDPETLNELESEYSEFLLPVSKDD